MLGDSGAAIQADGTAAGNFSMVGVGDGITFPATMQTVPFLFNGATWDRARGDATGGAFVQGPGAAGSAPVGHPVLMAGQDSANTRVIRTNAFGGIVPGTTPSIALADNASNIIVEPAYTDNTTGTLESAVVINYPFLFNGSGWDRQPGTAAHGGLVQPSGNDAVRSGQQAVTNAAVALATGASKNICLKALAGNTQNVYIGPTGITTATGMELAAGDAYCGPVSNTNLIFVIAAAAGQSVSWIATN
jgi:hypothetical protein